MNIILYFVTLSFQQNPVDIISMNEALLVRFRSDDTISNKGFSAIYLAVDSQGSDEIIDGDEDEADENL